MATLRRGSSGAAVTELQEKLKELGFDPGDVDSSFGPSTEAAVIAFQESKGLDADGVAGPNTLSALGLEGGTASAGSAPTSPGGAASAAVAGVTVDIVSKMFPGTKRTNIETNLPFVLEALNEVQLGDKPMVLMALGTIRAETASFRPISEGVSKFNTSPGGHPFDLYDNRSALGNQGPPDGQRFKGRGFVQLTGRANYTTIGQKLGAPLVDNPDLANEPATAARILARFLKDRESQIRAALAKGDLAKARKLVNGGSHGLDAFTDAYNIGDKLIA